ncbi:MAG TPA: lysozyme inhibitor LprI family protein [Gemmatimonadaceae bacterium]|nr:lysozyme inhibitor LprI family protein [Gemmatimonadaceae bacterium]
MMRPLYLSIVIAIYSLQLAACDDGTRDETAVARSRDSSLASDLRLATGDSARLTGADAAAGTDTHGNASVPPMVESRNAPAPGTQSARTVSNGPAATVTESSGAVDGASSGPATVVSAEGYAGPSCASPALPDQRRCLLAYLARSDVALDRNYQALIAALEREAGPQPAGREPPTVLRLRTAQRNWLVYRDDECRRRNAGTEGPLWAPTRAQCLAEYSDQRSQELANALAGRASAKPVATKSVATRSATTRSATTKRAKNSAKRSRRGRR